jgi:hypothetical protein
MVFQVDIWFLKLKQNWKTIVAYNNPILDFFDNHACISKPTTYLIFFMTMVIQFDT